MVCSNCKTEVEDGLVYCPICGKANQIVPDYNLLEDDILPQMVGKKPGQVTGINGGTSGIDDAHARKGFRAIYVILPLVIVLSIVLICVLNSARYMLFRAQGAEAEGNYENAITYYLRARDKNDSLESLIGLGRCYRRLNDPTEAKKFLKDALMVDKESAEAYEEYIMTYEDLSDYEGMLELSRIAVTEDQKKIFEAHHITPPEFSQPGGSYNDDIELSLVSRDGFEVYYTLDGTDPNSANGKLFKKAITIKEGTTGVKAVCKNKDGKFGSIKEEEYNVVYEVPERPTVSPMTGVFRNPMSVTITSNTPDGIIYYTWDGSDPNISSARYSGALTIPEGDNILSVIVVNKHGISSDVVRCSYSFLPNKPAEEEG